MLVGLLATALQDTGRAHLVKSEHLTRHLPAICKSDFHAIIDLEPGESTRFRTR